MINEHEKTAVSTSSTPIDEKQPSEITTNTIITNKPLMCNGKIIKPFETVDGKTLLGMDLPPLTFTIEKILPQGLFILSGSPKVGKSWLSLNFCQAVATGGLIWNYQATKGEVLYLALEDRLNRLQDRLSYYGDEDTEGIADMHFCIRSLMIQDGLVEQVTDFMESHPNTRLIVIDTMQHIRNNGNDKNAYVSDYRDMNILREITNKFELTLLLVHHNRKQDDPDPLNKISGSTGLVGATDGAFVLEKKERLGKSGKLSIGNRDTEDFAFILEFDNNCHWKYIKSETPEETDDPLYKIVAKFIEKYLSFNGTATKLHKALSEEVTEFKYSPATLSKTLRAGVDTLNNKYKTACDFDIKGNEKIIMLDLIN